MSSILDALRKLEQEKAGREPSAHAPIRELNLERDIDLTPQGGRRRSSTGTAMLIFVGVLVVAGITAGVSTVVVMMSHQPALPPPVAMNTPAPQPAANPAVPAATTPQPSSAVAPPVPQTVTVVKPVQVAQAIKPETQKPKPEPKPEKPAPAPQPAEPMVQPAELKEPAGEDKPAAVEKMPLEKLPLLTESERVRLGLPPIKINIVGLPNSRNSRASALINMQKVYVGENIPDTDARLIDVDLHGVGLEVRGKRYYFSKR